MRVTLRRFTFTTTMRVINRVHHHTADGRTNAAPTHCARFTDLAQAMLCIADLTNSRTAFDMLNCTPENVLKMRTLAAQLRGHAAETTIELYRRKFEEVASELEEGAVDAESRTSRFRLVS